MNSPGYTGCVKSFVALFLCLYCKHLHMPQSHAWTCNYIKPEGVGITVQPVFAAVTMIKQHIASSGRHTLVHLFI